MTFGVFKSWTNGLKRLGSIRNAAQDQLNNSAVTLTKYINDEKLSPFDRPIPQRQPPIDKWESRFVRSPISQRAMGHAWTFEFDYIKHQKFDLLSAKYAFDYGSLFLMTSVYQIHLTTIRVADAKDFTLSFHGIRYVALGFLLGQERQALSLLKMYLHAYNKNWIYYKEYPIYCLTINILADHFQLPRVYIPEKTNNKAFVDEFLQHWQTPDVEILNKLLLQLCDLHTHKIKTNTFKIRFLHEFDDKIFGYFAFEYFLIRKLRAEQGLEIPEIEHPLIPLDFNIDTVVDSNEHEPLYLQVLAKMQSQGFDVEKAVNQTLGQ